MRLKLAECLGASLLVAQCVTEQEDRSPLSNRCESRMSSRAVHQRAEKYRRIKERFSQLRKFQSVRFERGRESSQDRIGRCCFKHAQWTPAFGEFWHQRIDAEVVIGVACIRMVNLARAVDVPCGRDGACTGRSLHEPRLKLVDASGVRTELHLEVLGSTPVPPELNGDARGALWTLLVAVDHASAMHGLKSAAAEKRMPLRLEEGCDRRLYLQKARHFGAAFWTPTLCGGSRRPGRADMSLPAEFGPRS
jgi:hypothetical protein